MMTDGRNLIAILRGVTPDTVSDIGHALFDCGIARIEVPLNTTARWTVSRPLSMRWAIGR